MEVQKLKHICKFCKKSFPCGRSLGGHIRTHLPKPGYELRENPKKTWRAADPHDLLTNNPSLSPSSIEIENPKSIKKNQTRGKRSCFPRNNSHSSVSEIVETDQQEEEEEVVAMCLIMLSQDVGSWRDDNTSSTNGKKYESAANGYVQKGLKSKAIEVSANKFDSNYQNSKNLASKRRREKFQNKDSLPSATDNVGKVTIVQPAVCGYVKDDAEIKKFHILKNGFVRNDQNKQSSESKRKIGQIASWEYVKMGSNLEEYEGSENEIIVCDQKSNDDNELDSEFQYNVSKSSFCKRSKFQCTTCNKMFHSHQALGGHRASHKKLVGGSGCSLPVSKLEENDIARIDVPPSPYDQKYQKLKQEQEQEVVPEMRMGSSTSTSSKKVMQQHVCPICFRVFPSGQALGGHKRSHLLVPTNANISGIISEKTSNDQSNKLGEVVERSSNTETRDLLDLNFPPAPIQDETTSVTTTTPSSSTCLGFMKPYWCVDSSHIKHEPLLGLISN